MMQFGYFDDQNKEYVITRTDTPRSWSNYLGSTEYGAIITNNGGGYSFYKSAAQGRFMRMRFNSVPLDQPGRYIYIHDKNSKDFWSATWQPVGKPLNQYESECRHGTAYTIIRSKYSNILTETLYFVPLGESFECWKLQIKNEDSKKRSLRLFTFVEYACNWNAQDDLNNLQYAQYIASMDCINGIIDHGTNIHLPSMPDHFEKKDQGRHTFMGIIGAKVSGFDTNLETFLGPYHTYANPLVVENGACTNSKAVGDNPCGTLQIDLDLNPGESKTVIVILGIGKADVEGQQAIKMYSAPGKIDASFQELKNYWHNRLQGFSVETPDSELNSMLNMWSPFNCLITYSWSRAASLVYAGARDGLGYRDTLQDLIGVMHLIPEEALKRLELMITGQVASGCAMPVVKPFSHHPGQESPPKEDVLRSDDGLWLFNTIPIYVKETGDISFYDKILPYADQGEDTVLGHMKRVMEFSIRHSGKHGLPCGLSADWNDCLRLGYHGESIFVAFQLRYALKTYIEICTLLNKPDEIEWAKNQLKQLDGNLNKHCWDGDWFIRAITENGMKLGSKENDEGSIFMNVQTWAVYSGHATKEQSEKCLAALNKFLFTPYGIMLCDPPFDKTDPRVVRATFFNKGMKENAGIFCHTQGWAVIAETLLGHGNQAYQYFKTFMPSAYNDKAEIRQIEPYVYCQSTHSKTSPRYGASRLPWLSGSATWAYHAVTQYILGIQPDYHGLRIDPCIPEDWKEVTLSRRFRQKQFNIKIDNSAGVLKGVKKLILNQEEVKSNLIPLEKMRDVNEVRVVMG